MKKWFKIVLQSSLVFSAVTFAIGSIDNPLHGESTERPIIDSPQDFRLLAKKAIPAVVSVRVQAQKKGKPQVFSPFGDQSDPFNDFWQHFFNLPNEGDSRSQIVSGQASGFLVSQDGYILTNSHVVNGFEKITVTLTNGKEYDAKVIAEDPYTEVAVIKIEGKNLPFLKLGNSDDLEVGQWVAAIGNPLGLQASLSVGVVSAKGRSNLDIARFEDFIQTDAAINVGNSGGPLMDLQGHVIGINTAIATRSGGYMGIGFAVPSNIAKQIFDEAVSGEKITHGYIGVALQPIDENLAKSFQLNQTEGALVTEVLKNSPAEKGGLKPEDIIVKMDGKPIESLAALRNTIFLAKPGAIKTFTVWRNNQQTDIKVEIGHLEETTKQSLTNSQAKTKLGFEVNNLTPDLANSLGYTQDQGVVVTHIDPASPAALAGLKNGTLIMAVNRKKVENVEQFQSAVQTTPEGSPVLLQIKEGKAVRFIALIVD